jgi:hypothetical protein
MKTRFPAVLLLLLTIIFVAAPLVSCNKEASTDKQKEKFLAYFTDVYTAFNNHEFDKYLEYLDMDADTETQIKTNLEQAITLFNSEYDIKNLGYTDNGDGTYIVTIQFLVKATVLADKTTSQLNEVNLFTVKSSGDSYLITKIVQGETVAVTEAVS